MKKINKILTITLITIISFFLNNIKVEAAIGHGATLKELYDGITKDETVIYDGDEVCFFKNIETDQYILLYFEYRNSGDYYVYDLTNQFASANYYSQDTNLEFNTTETTFKSVSDEVGGDKWFYAKAKIAYHTYQGDVQTGCKKIELRINSETSIEAMDAGTNANTTEYYNYYTLMQDNKKIDGISEQEVMNAFKAKAKVSQDDKISCDVKMKKNASETLNVTLKQDSSGVWYLAQSENKICFATTSGTNVFVKIFDFPSNFKETFTCDDYRISAPVGENIYSECDMYAIHKDYWSDVSEEITSSVHEAGTKLGVYVLYNNSSAPVINIYKNKSGGIDIEGETTITNINVTTEITNAFLNNNKDKQPIYILETSSGSYMFSNERNTNATKIYMNYQYLLDVASLGEKEIEKTCQNILGSDFIKFLNNNVFKVIYIAVPILLLVLTTFDFAKVVFIDDKEGIKGSFKKFGKRVIAAVLIYLVPTILIFVTDIIGSNEIKECAQVFKNYAE